jgi:hypothetical protein
MLAKPLSLADCGPQAGFNAQAKWLTDEKALKTDTLDSIGRLSW